MFEQWLTVRRGSLAFACGPAFASICSFRFTAFCLAWLVARPTTAIQAVAAAVVALPSYLAVVESFRVDTEDTYLSV